APASPGPVRISVGDAYVSPPVRRALDLVEYRPGEVDTRDVGLPVLVEEGHFPTDPVGAAFGARIVRPVLAGRAYEQPVTVDLIRLERFEDRVHLLRLRGVCGRDVTFDKSRRIGSRPERAEATDHYEPCAHFVSLPTDLQIERPEPSGVVSTGRHGNDHHIRTGEIGKVGVDVGLDVFDPIERDRRTTAAHCDHFMPATGGFGDDGRTGVTGATDDDDLHVPVLVLGTWYLGIGTSPPWSGSGTGEHRRRRGGGASEASQEPHRDFPAVLRTAPPRPFVPLPHSADRFLGGKSSAPAAGPPNTSPPGGGSGTGGHRRGRGGGASEAGQETTVISLRSYGPRPLGTSCHSPTPLTASWGRKPLPQRQGRPTPLPRG